MTTQNLPANVITIFEAVRDQFASDADFDSATLGDDMVACHAADAPEGAMYRISWDGQHLWGEWSSTDRYLSQSIESDLVYTGDDLWDMIDEELVDLGWSQPDKLGTVEHYRNDAMEFVFRTRIPINISDATPAVTDDLVRVIKAYQAVFCELGDMTEEED